MQPPIVQKKSFKSMLDVLWKFRWDKESISYCFYSKKAFNILYFMIVIYDLVFCRQTIEKFNIKCYSLRTLTYIPKMDGQILLGRHPKQTKKSPRTLILMPNIRNRVLSIHISLHPTTNSEWFLFVYFCFCFCVKTI